MENVVADPVMEALKHIEEIKPASSEEVAGIKQKIGKLEDLKKKLLPIEEAAINQARSELMQLSAKLKLTEIRSLALSKGYKRIHLEEPLSWRNKDGMPRLAVFTLDSSIMRLMLNCRGHKDGFLFWKRSYIDSEIFLVSDDIGQPLDGDSRRFPQYITKCYEDIRGALRNQCIQLINNYNNWSLVSLEQECQDLFTRSIMSAQFAGVIPAKARNSIDEAKKIFGEHRIFLVAEVAQWSFEKTVSTVPKDPLVIGLCDDEAFLIDAFDVTTLENYVKEEFTT